MIMNGRGFLGVQSLQSTQQPVIGSADTVPFRFTPNMQHFMGPIHTEGLLVAGIMAIGRGLTDPDVSLLIVYFRHQWLMDIL